MSSASPTSLVLRLYSFHWDDVGSGGSGGRRIPLVPLSLPASTRSTGSCRTRQRCPRSARAPGVVAGRSRPWRCSSATTPARSTNCSRRSRRPTTPTQCRRRSERRWCRERGDHRARRRRRPPLRRGRRWWWLLVTSRAPGGDRHCSAADLCTNDGVDMQEVARHGATDDALLRTRCVARHMPLVAPVGRWPVSATPNLRPAPGRDRLPGYGRLRARKYTSADRAARRAAVARAG